MNVSIVTTFGEKKFELTVGAAEALVWAAEELVKHPIPGPIKIEIGDQRTLAHQGEHGKWLLFGAGKGSDGHADHCGS